MKRIDARWSGAALLALAAGGCGSNMGGYNKASGERPRENTVAETMSANIGGGAPAPAQAGAPIPPAPPIPPDPNANR